MYSFFFLLRYSSDSVAQAGLVFLGSRDPQLPSKAGTPDIPLLHILSSKNTFR
jgi:hypothetical protein